MILTYPTNLPLQDTGDFRRPGINNIRAIMAVLQFGGEWSAAEVHQATGIRYLVVVENLESLEKMNRIFLGRDRNGKPTYIAKEFYGTTYGVS